MTGPKTSGPAAGGQAADGPRPGRPGAGGSETGRRAAASRTTIYSVAHRCGVSAATVSRALSRPHMVRTEVRERVLRAAAELGYRPNPAGRGLATGRTNMIGLLVSDITNPFFPPVVRTIQQAASDAGSSTVLVDARESAAAEQDLLAQLHGQVDGIVIASPRARSRVLRAAARQTPCVLVNRVVTGMYAVTCDTAPALAEAGELLRDLGHHRMALMSGPAVSWAAQRRTAVVRRWAAGSGADLVELGAFPASFEGGVRAGHAWLETTATAAFAFDDLMACGVLAALAERGVRVPADRSLVGCDDVLLASAVTPALTTVRTPVAGLGATAIELLRRCIADPEAEPVVVEVPGTLVRRASTGPAAR